MPLVTDDHSTSAQAAHLVVNDEDILLASVDGSAAGKRRNSSSDEVDSGYSKSSTPTDSAPTAGSVRFGIKRVIISTRATAFSFLFFFVFFGIVRRLAVGVPACRREKSASKATERRIIPSRTGRLATPTPSEYIAIFEQRAQSTGARL